MSRVGNKIITIPEGVTVNINDGVVAVAGPKGNQEFKLNDGITVAAENGEVKVRRRDNSKSQRSLHGTSARVIGNIITGLSAGFTRRLDFKGVGFTIVAEGNKMNMRLGYSHPVILDIPEGITVNVVKNSIMVEGSSKELVGAFAAKLRDTKKPEVYKGKGIKYHEEIIKKKAGKAAQTASS
ncbi:MAG: 50S ribosomal protein L6 [Candidatus Berkelbacteria bacterium]